MFNRIRYPIKLKYNNPDFFYDKYLKTKINSDDNFDLQKTSNMRNVVVLTKSVFNYKNLHYDYEIFSEKCL